MFWVSQWLSSKESTCNAGGTGHVGSIPALGRFPGGGNGNLLQCFCLENPMDRRAWKVTVQRTAKIQTLLKQMSSHTCFSMLCLFLLYSKVNQQCVYIYPLFIGFLSHLGHHRALSRIPSGYSRFSLVTYFMHSINSEYMPIPVSQ